MLEYKNRKLASDIEAIGFYDVVHKPEDVHCLCSVDVDTDEVLLFHNHPEFDNAEVWDPYDEKMYTIPVRAGTLEEGVEFWSKAAKGGSILIVHNARTYDQPLVDKVWPNNGIPYNAWHDTFNQSKVQWFERPTPKGCKGAHGLKAYGVRCGVNKPEIEDWSYMDAAKLHRVVQDTRIQAKTYLMLEAERKYFKDTFGADFTQALKIEDLYATECFKQEVTGVKVDVEHIRRCIEDLDTKIALLTDEIEPHLPPTVKGTGGKVSRSEMAEIFGFSSAKIKDNYVQRNRNGEVETVVEKPYFKPTTNYTRTIKTNRYIGFNVSYGVSPAFEKKKELTDWIKEHHPDTKTKEWEIDKEEVCTEVLNKNTCDYFSVQPEDVDVICGPFTRVSIEPSRMTQGDVVKGYLIRLGWDDAEDWNLKKDRLLIGDVSQQEAIRQGERFDHNMTEAHIAIVLAWQGDKTYSTRRLETLVNGIVTSRKIKALVWQREREEEVLVFFSPDPEKPIDSSMELANTFTTEAQRQYPQAQVAIGLGQIAREISAWRNSYRDAVQALDLARRLQTDIPLYIGDLGVYQLILSLSDRDKLLEFCNRTLGSLVEYDHRQHADLIKTLEAFFACHGNLSQTAEMLIVHRNTLLYRMNRINEIAEIDLNRPETRLALHLALTIRRLLTMA